MGNSNRPLTQTKSGVESSQVECSTEPFVMKSCHMVWNAWFEPQRVFETAVMLVG